MKVLLNVISCAGITLVLMFSSHREIAQQQLKSFVGGDDCNAVGLQDYTCRVPGLPHVSCGFSIKLMDSGVSGDTRNKVAEQDPWSKCPTPACTARQADKIKPEITCDEVPIPES